MKMTVLLLQLSVGVSHEVYNDAGGIRCSHTTWTPVPPPSEHATHSSGGGAVALALEPHCFHLGGEQHPSIPYRAPLHNMLKGDRQKHQHVFALYQVPYKEGLPHKSHRLHCDISCNQCLSVPFLQLGCRTGA